MGKPRNEIDSREDWLRAATDLIRPEFNKVGEALPDKMRFAIAFTSQGKRAGRITGEAWPAKYSADGAVEIIIRADKDEPMEVLGILVHQLTHTVAGREHGKEFRELALKVGLDDQHGIRHAMPGLRLTEFLRGVAEGLGPIPHARLNFMSTDDVADKPKKQGTRMRKASCPGEGCGYKCRIAERWVDEIGAPVCPKHGPMNVERPNDKKGTTDSHVSERADGGVRSEPEGSGREEEAVRGIPDRREGGGV